MPAQPGLFSSRELTAPEVHSLVQAGRQFVFRYYCDEATRIPGKILRAEEAAVYAAARVILAAVYEYGGGAPRSDANQPVEDRRHPPRPHLEDFAPDRARLDAQFALAQAAAVGQPPGSAIYFAVDFNFVAETDLQIIIRYFEILRDTLRAAGGAPPYDLGVYGSGLVCRRVRSALPEVRFACLARGSWAEFQSYYDWAVRQTAGTGPFAFAHDDAEAKGAFGGFQLPAPTV